MDSSLKTEGSSEQEYPDCPKDFIKEDGLFNIKYLKSVHGKKKRISERVNLFTGEHLFTPSYGNELRWEWVDQK